MSIRAWLSELNRILIVFIPSTLLGLLTGYVSLFFIIGLIVYGLWTVRQLITLKRWLDEGAMLNDAPEYLGIVDQHVASIVNLQKQNQLNIDATEALVEQFNQMIAALPDAIVIMQTSGEILSANRAADLLLSIDPEVDINTRIVQLIRSPLFTEYFSAGEFSEPLEIRGTATDEAELSIRIIAFGTDKLVLIAQDMSQSARLYEMRRSFISNASHELRTPLTVIFGYLETLSMHQGLPEECKAALKSAEVQAQRMKQLVEDLLTLSRLESATSIADMSEIVPIASLITEVVKEVKLSTWFDEHNIKTSIMSDAMLKGDLQEIHSVISNLVNNAVKHTDAGTAIEVIWQKDDDDKTHLIVTDNGLGIAPDHIERLTERFYRVDTGRSREKGGTGLGLSIVKHIMSRHEGTLSITSDVGQGTTFTCNFPHVRIAYEGENSIQSNT